MNNGKRRSSLAVSVPPVFFLLMLNVIFSPGCLDPDPETPPNKPPVLESVTADPPRIFLGETSTIAANAYDPDGDKLIYEWQTDLGLLSGKGHQIYYAAPPCCALSDIVRVTVKDGKGGVTRGSVGLKISR